MGRPRRGAQNSYVSILGPSSSLTKIDINQRFILSILRAPLHWGCGKFHICFPATTLFLIQRLNLFLLLQ